MMMNNMGMGTQVCFRCNGTGEITKLKLMKKVCPGCNGSKVIGMNCLRCPKCQGDGKEYPLIGRKGIPFECKLCCGKGFVTELWIPCQICQGEGKTGDIIPKKCTKCNGNGFFKGNMDGMSNMMGNYQPSIQGTQPVIPQPSINQQFVSQPIMSQPILTQPPINQQFVQQPIPGMQQGYSSNSQPQQMLKDVL